MKTFLIILAVIGVLLAGLLARLVLYPADQAVKVYEKTLDADNAIYNYEYFKQAYQDVRAMDVRIANAQAELDAFVNSAGPRDKWDRDDKTEHARLSANLTGTRNVRADLVATYNARARMANRSLFMGRDIPQSID